MRSIRCAITCALVAAPLVGTAAPAETPGQEQDTLQEVVVTARFKSESLQNAPLAITALTGAQLEAHGFTDVTQVSSIAPNVNIEPAGTGLGKLAIVSIRGVGQSDYKYTFEPGVGFYLDGVYWGTAFGSIFDLTDIDSVEILRGPQGTLFGKNTEGGAVVVQSTKPTGMNTGYLEAGYGSFQRERFKGAFDVSLIPDHLFLRIAAGSNRSDGYQKVFDFACENPALAGKLKPTTYVNQCQVGTYGGDDVQLGRFSLRWVASESFEATWEADLLNDHGEEPAGTLLAINLPANTNALAGPVVSSQLGLFNQRLMSLYGIALDKRFLTGNPYSTYATYYDPITGVAASATDAVQSWGSGLTLDWATPFSGVHVKSITAYRGYHGNFAQDSSGAPVTQNMPVNFVQHHQFSEELQVSGRAFDNALDWTAGAYYLDSNDFNSGVVDQPSNVGGKGILFLTGDPAHSKDASGFLHANYSITEKWALEAGVRYSHETKDYTFYRYLPNLVGIVPTLAPPLGPLFPLNTGTYLAGFAPPPTVAIEPISRVDPKVGLSYSVTPDIMSYVQYSTGFKSAGFNPRPLNRSQVTSFGPESLKSYEVGLKSEWLEHRLRANLALFDSEYRGLQLPVSTVDASGTPAYLTESVGHARIQGVELELASRPWRDLSIESSVGYLNYKSVDLGSAAFDPVANPNGPFYSSYPALTPRWKGNLAVQYAFHLGHGGTVTPRADYTYQSIVYNDPQDQLISAQPGYGLLKASLKWQSPDGSWEATLLGTNLTARVYYLTIANGLSTYDNVIGNPGRPRELLLTLRKNF